MAISRTLENAIDNLSRNLASGTLKQFMGALIFAKSQYSGDTSELNESNLYEKLLESQEKYAGQGYLELPYENTTNSQYLFKVFNLIEIKDIPEIFDYCIGEFGLKSAQHSGIFYTPQSLVDLANLCLDTGNNSTKSTYDPTCGIGNMFKYYPNAKYYGEDMDVSAISLLRCRMKINGVKDFDIRHTSDGTLTDSNFEGQKFDFILANPPYNIKKWFKEKVVFDERYQGFGRDVSKISGNMAWVLHCLHHLSEDGEAAIYLPNGVLNGSEDLEIREALIKRGNLACSIKLPGGLFTNTGIPCVLWILKKNNPEMKGKIMMVNAEGLGVKVKNGRTLSEHDVHCMARSYWDYCNSYEDSYVCDIDKGKLVLHARVVGPNELAKNEYDLNIPRYNDESKEYYYGKYE